MRLSYPRISVITPSFNQAQFVEQTIRSVLDQGYPNLEYIVVDGGSRDNTLEILKKYSNKIRWISEPDKGQSDAINKGLALATGDIVAYLNSDDLLLPQCLFRVAQYFSDFPTTQWVTGFCKIIDHRGRETRRIITVYKNFLLSHYHFNTLLIVNYISQMSTFWRKDALGAGGQFSLHQHYVMDYDYWLRLGRRSRPGIIRQYLSCFRMYPGSKSIYGFMKQFDQSYELTKRNTTNPAIRFLAFTHAKMIIFVYHVLSLSRRKNKVYQT